MHLESHESADDRQYYDYHMDRNGHSLHGDEQDLTPTKMKAPTAEETLSAAYKEAGWMYQLSVASGSCDHVSIALAAIESHTAAHTEGLREENADLERENNNYRLVYDSVVKNRDELMERVKEFEGNSIHPMALAMAKDMTFELKANEHKGDWSDWRDVTAMLSELEWHKAKLMHALRDNDKDRVREYIADCANILMFIGNAGYLYEDAKEACKKKESK